MKKAGAQLASLNVVSRQRNIIILRLYIQHDEGKLFVFPIATLHPGRATPNLTHYHSLHRIYSNIALSLSVPPLISTFNPFECKNFKIS